MTKMEKIIDYEEIFRAKDLYCKNCDKFLDEDNLNKVIFNDKWIYLCVDCKFKLYNQDMKGGED